MVVKSNPGFSIFGISVLVSVCCLPLYATAEKIQERERALTKKMAGKVARIRKHFTGDERYMLLAMYYRENNYHPLMALRSSLSLLIQIPFFIAAYHFISHLGMLKGEAFLFIRDLGSPDGLLKIGAFSLNLLPLAMTLINSVSGALYTRGFPLREKVQLYALALIFLVLLYGSPAALVLYWTCNNLFSLVKNIAYKTGRPALVLYLCVLAGLAAGCVFVFFFRSQGRVMSFWFKGISVAVSLLIAGVPLYVRAFRYLGNRFFYRLKDQKRETRVLFILSALALWVLSGLVIPFNVVASDPAAFSLLSLSGAPSNPLGLLAPPALIALGLFVFWPVYLFLLFPDTVKALCSLLAVVLALTGILNAFFFFGPYGVLSPTLSFSPDVSFSPSLAYHLLNVGILVVVAAGMLRAFTSGRLRALSSLMGILLLAGGGITLWKGAAIQKGYASYTETLARNARGGENAPGVPAAENTEGAGPEPVLRLSRTGKNVLVIMLDRAVGSYVPLIFEERPELASAFSGFVYYPNTVSFFRATNLGAPPIFGGYEYTPEKLHERKDRSMADKNDEALLLLPELFKGAGYGVSVFDLPNVNYKSGFETSFFIERGINAASLTGRYTGRFLAELGENAPKNALDYGAVLQRNFVMFALFSIVPPFARSLVYRKGSYWSTGNYVKDTVVGGSTVADYASLYYLPRLTTAEAQEPALALMVNNLTHDPSYLQYPGYTVVDEITDFGPNGFNGSVNSHMHYHVNAAAYLLLAEFFERLRGLGVYDNTRIILVSDHDEKCVKPLFSPALNAINTYYNPILFFKDFDAAGDMQTDTSFMTTADVPLLAVRGILDNPVNPFTGKPLAADKANGVNIYLGGSSRISDYYNWEALDKTSSFYQVKDSIFDERNWEKITRRY
jgi:YidC/Oxa1 family membrane protein insertase